MYVDKQAEFSDSQAVTATAISTNVLDIFSSQAGGDSGSAAAIIEGVSPNTRIDVGLGEDVWLIVSTAVAATDTGSDATLTVSFESADDAALTSNVIVHYTTGALAFATFSPAGTRLVAIKIPADLYRRYIGVRYTVAAGPLTAGQFDAFLTTGAIARNLIYKSAFTVQ